MRITEEISRQRQLMGLSVLLEYNDKLVQQLISKFKTERPSLNDNIIRRYIDKFAKVSRSPSVTKKDIAQYTWQELERTIDMQPQRIRAGKPDVSGADALYNKDGLRLYVGNTQRSCIKYGNGYSWCISARGEESMYSTYRFEEKGTPYFLFDDNKSSELLSNKKFVDPTRGFSVRCSTN